MILSSTLPEFFNDICEVIRLFISAPEIRPAAEGEAPDVIHTHAEASGKWTEIFQFEGESRRAELSIPDGNALERKKQLKRLIKHTLYLLLRDHTGIKPPWGSLTGIRPTRLIYEAMEKGMDASHAVKWLSEAFDVSPRKAGLLCEVIEAQRPVIGHPNDEFDLYIGIPFCTTRCAYCSFASDELGNGKLVEPYIAALMHEIEAAGRLMRERGFKVRAAYMGGGTPTALNAKQLERVIAAAQRAFPNAIEWTCEAGRPDTIDRAKLQVLLDAGITRISINPQTLCDRTLELVGRRHTARDTIEAYNLARSMGFTDINMDLIAALPDESLAEFERSMGGVCALSPESITVHTLAIKRASKLHELNYRQVDAGEALGMVEAGRRMAGEAGYIPYYLYRQKYMAGNLENVGYSKPDHVCLYNIDVMEETTHNLALGAGAISKWIFPEQRRIERAANVRNIELYIQRVDEMVQRKAAVIDMYMHI